MNATDLSRTWSVAAFFRACATAPVNLHAFRRAWGLAYGDLLDRGYHGTSDCQLAPYKVVGGQPHAPDCSLRIPLGLPFPPPCAPALVACGAVPPGWPEAAAQRLVDAMLRRRDPHYPPDWGPMPDLDTIFTDATGRVVYRDGFDDLRLWREELGITEDWDCLYQPGSLAILVESVSLRQVTDRIGHDRMPAFVTKLREEGPGPGDVHTYHFRVAFAAGSVCRAAVRGRRAAGAGAPGCGHRPGGERRRAGARRPSVAERANARRGRLIRCHDAGSSPSSSGTLPSLAVLLGVLLSAEAVHGQTVHSRVVGVTDGDSITVSFTISVR